jgi:hypothetical protein
MKQAHQEDKDRFIYPRSRYYGEVKPEYLLFSANLQEFSQKLDYITNLETSGKLTLEEAYEQIETLWENLTHSKNALGITKKS